MKALTLTQPYATLVAHAWKEFETRSWRTSYRGPLAIHAAKGFGGVGGRHEFERLLMELDPALVARLEDQYGRGPAKVIDLPLGAIIAVSWLEDCVPVEDVRDEIREMDEVLNEKHGLPGWEHEVGDYSDGRFAWKLRDPVVVTTIPWKGHLGLWDVPDEVIPEYARLAIRHPA